jgi:hypothetical protein
VTGGVYVELVMVGGKLDNGAIPMTVT